MVKSPNYNPVAKEMAQVYKDYSATYQIAVPDSDGVTESFITDEGLEVIGNLFETVPLGERAAVYLEFNELLEQEGILPNVAQFQGSVH